MSQRITKGYIAFSIFYFILFILGIAIIGLYATDINHSTSSPYVNVNSDWVFAVVVGTVSSVTCLVYFIPFVFHSLGIIIPIWNLAIFILNISLFGVFAKRFLHANPHINVQADPSDAAEMKDGPLDATIVRMKNAIWVDLASALLWFLVMLGSVGYWLKHRDVRTRFTGRAYV